MFRYSKPFSFPNSHDRRFRIRIWGILKQKLSHDSKEQIVRYHSGIWHASQQKYSTIKKEILSIVLCLQKFQDDLFNKKFLIRTNCKAAPSVLTKDV